MRWFRSHIRFGSRLALVALAIQFLLTFSHIDTCDLFPSGGGAATASMVADAAGTPVDKGSPLRKSDRTADQSCPICALIQLAATSTPSAAPVLLPPVWIGGGRLDLPVMATLAASTRRHFQARAPPIA
jgi:hypothetical protein